MYRQWEVEERRIVAQNKFAKDFSRILRQLPDVFLTSGHSVAPSVNHGSTGEQIMLPTQLSDLISLCSAAPCGKALQTVVDKSVRCTLETAHVKVDWAALPEVLSCVTNALTPNASLQAHFYKVLVYRPGDFFKYHHDSKRAVEHLLTLTVDLGAGKCDGGDTVFRQGALTRSDDDLDTDEDQPITWKSSGEGGDWCCWFTSQPHRVAAVTQGYRVVAMFDVLARFPEGLPKSVARRAWTSIRLGSTGSLPLVGQVAQLLQWSLCPADAVNAARTCRGLKELLSSASMLLCQWLRQESITLQSIMQISHAHRLGLVLQNRYSFDGQLVVNPWHLRGRDRIAYEAFELFGAGAGPPKVSSCKVVHETLFSSRSQSPREYLEQGFPGCHTVRFRVAREVTCGLIDSLHHNDALKLDGEALNLAGMPTLSEDEIDVLRSTNTELDDDLRHECWPFRGVLWACDRNYMDTHFLKFRRSSKQTADDSDDSDDSDDEADEASNSGSSGSRFEGPLWGNASMFALFWYKNAV
mmetsp:Transcript_10246/g.19475  ORF Transcript_10246/g.19475 Transcript_10246/m.19475 type:complete len:525 (-) Transcript_10246:96-1670(-)